MEFITRLVQTQQVNAVGKNLSALKKPMGANDNRAALFTVVDRTGPDQDFRYALAILQAHSIQERAPTFLNDLFPILPGGSGEPE